MVMRMRIPRAAGSLLTTVVCMFVVSGCAGEQRSEVPRYFVTNSPIDVGAGTPLCIAVQPKNQGGIWWWEPGRSGCASRSTGPTVFQAHEATVSSAGRGETVLRFRVGMHSSTVPFIDVQLVLGDGEMRELGSGARVRVGTRKDLNVPEGP